MPESVPVSSVGRRHSPKLAIACLLLTGLVSVCAAEPQIAARIESVPSQNPLLPALKMANQCLSAMDEIRDYEAVFVKEERPNGQVVHSKMLIRFREEPLSVYLKYVQPNAGREVIYMEGRYSNQLQVHEAGVASLLGTISLDPNGSLAMGESRYPITMIGMKRMVIQLMEQWLEDTTHDEVVVKFYPQAKMGERACEVIEVTHPVHKPGVTYHKTRLYRDKQTQLPVRVQEYGFPATAGAEPPLVSDFTYLDVKTNVGMTDDDFDTNNDRYGF